MRQSEVGTAEPGRPTRWRPIATVALFAVLPFVTFLSDNALEAETGGGFLLYPLVLLVPGVGLLLFAERRGGRRHAERAAIIFAAASFMLFKFLAVSQNLAKLGLPSGYVPAFAVWLALSALVVLVAVRLSRSPLSWTYAMVLGAILVSVSTWQYAFAPNRGGLAQAAGQVPAAVEGATPVRRPDVWFFLLDGYGRADVIAREVGHDNQPFLDELRERDFSVEPAATTSFPRTVPSLATTLAMDYTVGDGDAVPRRLYEVVRGDNATVRSFSALGYDYVAATDYALLKCEEFADVCLYPRAGATIGSTRSTVLSATPIQRLLARARSALSGDELDNVLAPDEVVRAVEQRRGDEPVFVYTHLIAPHPPYRYGDDCSRVPVNGDDLGGWKVTAAARARYADAVRCLNMELLKAVDAILENSPESIIVLQGDHGPGFGVPLNTSPNDWTDAELRERYPLLSALRTGPTCGPRRAPVVPVNTFRVVLSCVTGRRITELPPKRFSTAYGEAALQVERLRPVDLSPRP